jgi:hypothetical protein
MWSFTHGRSKSRSREAIDGVVERRGRLASKP